VSGVFKLKEGRSSFIRSLVARQNSKMSNLTRLGRSLF
jgi:hypothetical protein